MTNEEQFQLYRAAALLESFLNDHPEHDQADFRVYTAYEALMKVVSSLEKKDAQSNSD